MRVRALLLLLGALSLAKAQQVVNVYNWADYLPPKVIKLFEAQTGIHVNYATFDSNQDLFIKLKADPQAGYDVVFPSSYYIQRMAKAGLLLKLDHSQLSGMQNLNPRLLNRSFDPANEYSLPYDWGSTSIIVNDKYYDPHSIKNWTDLWQKRFRGQLLLTNDERDVFAIGLRTMGYSINEQDPEKIRQAYLKMKALLPNVKLFNSAGTQPIYLDEDATVGVIDSGDAYNIMRINPHLHFIYPHDGVNLWVDCMAISANAPHKSNAYAFVNFLLQPKIAKMISLSLGYSTPNEKAVQQMPKEDRDNPILNPPAWIFKHAEFEGDVGKATHLYLRYWELLKLSA